jgi:L-fucose isomerase
MMRTAIVTVADTRADFYAKRKYLIDEERGDLEWIKNQYECLESDVIQSDEQIHDFAIKARVFNPSSLIIHIPIWADPSLTVHIYNELKLPVLLLGNNRPETSSLVGMLGAGGALDQLGILHVRVFDCDSAINKNKVSSFIRAAYAIKKLRGQRMGRFGGIALGIVTGDIDSSQWQKEFGITVDDIDQNEIIVEAEKVDEDIVNKYFNWIQENVKSVEFVNQTQKKAFRKQIKSYIATKKMIENHKLDFITVKCQPEMSDGYVSQCLAHMLINGTTDMNGQKEAIVHACESDCNAALTMQIMHLISNGEAVSLLDVRWFNKKLGIWTLANCGAMGLDFYGSEEDPTGLSNVEVVPHAFGVGQGSALTGIVQPGIVTIARLCRNNGEYWMSIILGKVVNVTEEQMLLTTRAFPKAFVITPKAEKFLEDFGSNHVHMIFGDLTNELVMFCTILKMKYKLWKEV